MTLNTKLTGLTLAMFFCQSLYWQLCFGEGVPTQWAMLCGALFGLGTVGLMWGCLLLLDRHCRKRA